MTTLKEAIIQEKKFQLTTSPEMFIHNLYGQDNFKAGLATQKLRSNDYSGLYAQLKADGKLKKNIAYIEDSGRVEYVHGITPIFTLENIQKGKDYIAQHKDQMVKKSSW